MSDEEEEGFRQLSPSWARNNTLINWGRDGRSVTTIDLTYTDPHSAFRNAIRSVSRFTQRDDMTPEQFAFDFTQSLFGPYIQTSFLATVAIETRMNQRLEGGELWSKGDDVATMAAAIGWNAYETLQPGLTKLVSDFNRAGAFGGEPRVRSTGERYSVRDELAKITGHSPFTSDIPTAAYRDAKQYADIRKGMSTQMNRVLRDLGPVDPDKATAVYDRVNRRMEIAFMQLRSAMLAAEGLVDDKQSIYKSLVAGGFAQRDVAALFAGRYTPMVVSERAARETLLRAATPSQR